MVRSIRTGMETIDLRLIEASRTLGAGWLDTMMTVIAPLSIRGLIAGSILMFARGLGEFGATIIVAGNIPGVTQTIPLAIYEYVSSPQGDVMAMALCIVSITISVVILVFHDWLGRRMVRTTDMELQVTAEKHFGGFSLNVDFTVEGRRIGLFGPSGSGKSTLVSLIVGLHHPDRGRILVNGKPIFDSGRGINIPPERRRISMVFQRPHLFPHLSVKGNLLYGYKRCAPKDRKITLDSLLEVLQIGHLLKRGVKNLSGGEKQRIAIGRAVLSNPRMLVMDEPLSALDDSLKFQIIPFLKNACEAFAIPYLSFHIR